MRFASLFSLLLLPALAQAQDIELHWQSRFFDSEGAGVDGNIALELRILNDEGVSTWAEELSVPARDGYVEHVLGRTTPLPLADLPEPAFLQIVVDGLPMGEPRRLATTAMAARALAVPVSSDDNQFMMPCDGVGRLAWNEDAKTLYVCDHYGSPDDASGFGWQPFLPDRRECLPGQQLAMNETNDAWVCVDPGGSGGVQLPVVDDLSLFDTTCTDEGSVLYKRDSDQLLLCQADDLGNLYWTPRTPDRRECAPNQIAALDGDGLRWVCIDPPSGGGSGGTATGIPSTTNATLYDNPCDTPGQLLYNTDQRMMMVCDLHPEGGTDWTALLPDTSECAHGEALVVGDDGRWACQDRAQYVGSMSTFDPCPNPHYVQQAGTELCSALDPSGPTVVWDQPGHQLWRVPATAMYTIEARGAAGGTNGGGLGGRGALVSGGINLQRGDILRFVIGHHAGVHACSPQGAGGGGATVVLRRLRAGEVGSYAPAARLAFDDGWYIPLMVAGGGGGASGYRGSGACVEPGGDAPTDSLAVCSLLPGVARAGTTDVNFADYSGPGGGLFSTHTAQFGGVNPRAGNGVFNPTNPAIGGVPNPGYLQGNGGYGGGGAALHPNDYDGVEPLPDNRTVGGGGGGLVGGSTSTAAGMAYGGTSCTQPSSFVWQSLDPGSHTEGGQVILTRSN